MSIRFLRRLKFHGEPIYKVWIRWLFLSVTGFLLGCRFGCTWIGGILYLGFMAFITFVLIVARTS